MDDYTVVKAIHILSSAILFGTGLGTAFFFFRAHAPGNEPGRLAAARTTVTADWLFTTPAVIIQPATGTWLLWRTGVAWDQPWLVASYILYVIAGLCWLPVVAIQMRMRNMLESEALGEPLDKQRYQRLYDIWFRLGWPAFASLILVFFLMVAKPTW